MKITGLLLILACLAYPAVEFQALFAARPDSALFSQYLGVAALITMGLAQVIATRLRIVEWIFGPLDQAYRLHKWLGIGAMLAILLHDTIDAEMRIAGSEGFLHDLGETLGELSLYGLLILVVITIATFIPYHLWKWTHRFMGAFFAASAGHYLMVAKPFELTTPLGFYVTGFCTLAVVCYLYTLLPLKMRGRRPYRVTGIETSAGACAVTLSPQGRPLRHRPGQFAFLSVDHPGLEEPHPFTISSAPAADGSLRFSIKGLGDYTHRLARLLEAGQSVGLQGPFGHFTRPTGGRPEIWIAGGIGITPFLAWANTLEDSGGEIHLFYAVRRATEVPHLAELRDLATRHPQLKLHLWESSSKSRLTAEALAAESGLEVASCTVSFCGPAEMGRSLKEGLTRMGLPQKHFRYELFEIRTGIGLRKLAEWLWTRSEKPRRRLLDGKT